MNQNQSEIPEYLSKDSMFCRRVQVDGCNEFDFVLTRGPRIYLVNDNEVFVKLSNILAIDL